MSKKFLSNSILSLFLVVICCGVAWGQTGSGNPNDPLPMSIGQAQVVNDAPGLPDGNQVYCTHGDSSLGGTPEFEQVINNNPVYKPIWRVLDNMTFQDQKNAQIGIETFETLPAATVQEIKDIESLWNSANYRSAINRLKILEQSGLTNLAMGVSWKQPKELSGPPDWGTDVQVEVQGDTQETGLDFHDNTGNMITLVRRDVTTTNDCWTLNISLNGGATWSETFNYVGSAGCIDADIAVVEDYVYIAYVYGSSKTGARLRRASAIDGSIDSGYFYKTVFDKGVDINEVSLTSNAPDSNNYIYYSALLADNTIELYNITNTSSMNPYTTGITDAASSLDSCWNSKYPTGNYLVFSYVNTSSRVIAAMVSSYSSISIMDLDDCDGVASICAFDDHILVAFEFITSTPYTGRAIKYWISYDGGVSFLYGWVASPAANSEYFWSPDATARNDGGIAVVCHEEAGAMDPCWYRERPYSGGWSTPVTYNEQDVYTGSDMTVEWAPSSGVNHGSIWLVNTTTRYAFYDRSNWSQTASLMASPNSIKASTGGTVKFALDAGPMYGGKKYMLLGSVSGISPGIPLKGGNVLPLKWDLFTNITVAFANSPVFQNTFGKLNSSGKASAAMVSGPIPPSAIGATLYFAYPVRSTPQWFASNPVKVGIQ